MPSTVWKKNIENGWAKQTCNQWICLCMLVTVSLTLSLWLTWAINRLNSFWGIVQCLQIWTEARWDDCTSVQHVHLMGSRKNRQMSGSRRYTSKIIRIRPAANVRFLSQLHKQYWCLILDVSVTVSPPVPLSFSHIIIAIIAFSKYLKYWWEVVWSIFQSPTTFMFPQSRPWIHVLATALHKWSLFPIFHSPSSH